MYYQDIPLETLGQDNNKKGLYLLETLIGSSKSEWTFNGLKLSQNNNNAKSSIIYRPWSNIHDWKNYYINFNIAANTNDRRQVGCYLRWIDIENYYKIVIEMTNNSQSINLYHSYSNTMLVSQSQNINTLGQNNKVFTLHAIIIGNRIQAYVVSGIIFNLNKYTTV